MLLDIMLPGLDGYALLECLRPQGVPVIFITAKSAVKDRVQGLRLGADDYITKPFAAEELVARMETVLRRTGRGGRELCAYDVVLDTVNHTARRNGEPVELRRLEYDLLELLMRNRGAALYRDVMYERVWGGIPDTESLRTVDTHIARLRKKLGWMDKIETVYKIGYRGGSFFWQQKKEPKKTAAVSTQRIRDLGAARPKTPSGSRKGGG